MVLVLLCLVSCWRPLKALGQGTILPARFGGSSGAQGESGASKGAAWLAVLLQLRMMGLLAIIP